MSQSVPWKKDHMGITMPGPIKLPLKSIVVNPKYFPRSKIKKSRVDQFRQAMHDGEYIPPIFVGRDGNKNGSPYIVLEGVHRFTAAKIERLGRHIWAEFWSEKDKDMWLMDAARLNDKTRDPISPDELQEVARRKWREGLHDTHKIAQRIGRNVRFVERALQPIRAEERSKRNALISHLAQNGYTQAQIASEVGLSRRAVGKILMELNDTVSFSSIVNNSRNFSRIGQANGLNICPEMLNKNSPDPPSGAKSLPGRSPSPPVAAPVVLRRGGRTSRPPTNSNMESHDQNCDGRSVASVRSAGPHAGGCVYSPEADSSLNHTSLNHTGKIDDTNTSRKEPPSCIPSLVDINPDISLSGQATIRTLELIDEGWNISEIIENINQVYSISTTEVEVRNAAAIVLMLRWENPSTKESTTKIVDTLQTSDEKVVLLADLNSSLPKVLPTSKCILDWLKNNHSGHRDTILDIMHQEKIHQRSTRNGITPGKTEDNAAKPLDDLPDGVRTKFLEARGFLEDLLEKVKQGQYQGKSANKLLRRTNEIQIALNLLRDGLKPYV